MLRARLLTAAVAIPLLLLLVFAAPARLFAVVVGAIAIAGMVEYAAMVFAGRVAERNLAVVLGSLVVIAGAVGPAHQALSAALAGLVMVGLGRIVVCRVDFEQGVRDLGIALVGVLYVALLLPHFIWLQAAPHGPAWITFVLTVAMVGDTSGYFVGRALGRRKLIPRVSPGKTVEGALGILAASVIGALLAGEVLRRLVGWPAAGWEAAWLGLVMGILGQLGDLSESVIKRTFGVKESGWIFPGHGGVLDRIDSLLFPVTFVYYYVALVR